MQDRGTPRLLMSGILMIQHPGELLLFILCAVTIME